MEHIVQQTFYSFSLMNCASFRRAHSLPIHSRSGEQACLSRGWWMGIDTLPERPRTKPWQKPAFETGEESGPPQSNAADGLRSGALVQLSDAQLVAASLKGDTVAYGELINRHQDSVN